MPVLDAADVRLREAGALFDLDLRHGSELHSLRDLVASTRPAAAQGVELFVGEHVANYAVQEYSCQALNTPSTIIPKRLGDSGIYGNIPSGYALAVSFAANLKRIRLLVRPKMTQTDLGALLGIGQGAVSKWEQGKTQPAIEMLPAIADALGVDVRDLLAEEPLPHTERADRAQSQKENQRTVKESHAPSSIPHAAVGTNDPAGGPNDARPATRRREHETRQQIDAIRKDLIETIHRHAEEIRRVADTLLGRARSKKTPGRGPDHSGGDSHLHQARTRRNKRA